MIRTAFLIDGFNFYHSIKPLSRHLRWFNYKSYCHDFLEKKDELTDIYYFTALAFWRPDSMKRHEIFIRATETYGVKVIYGKFKPKKQKCPNERKNKKPICQECTQVFTKHEEKATDVNIALYSLMLAHKKLVDKIIFVTGDTDLIPAISMLKKDFPSIRVGVVFPFKRRTKELINVADFTYSTKEDILEGYQLPESIFDKTGYEIFRPVSWNPKKINK